LEYLAQRRKGRKEIKLPDLAILGVLARANPVLDSHATGKFAQAAKTFNYNNTKVTRSGGFEALPLHLLRSLPFLRLGFSHFFACRFAAIRSL
jgi:hypothetical protein